MAVSRQLRRGPRVRPASDRITHKGIKRLREQVRSLFAERYGRAAGDPGATTAPVPPLPNLASLPIFQTLLTHRSVRRFAARQLPSGTLEWLVAAAQSASTSSNLQTWSIVAISDPARKDAISRLCADQAFIREAPLFLIFCADLARLSAISAQEGQPGEGLGYLEMFLMAALDATLAAQNAVIAAEGLGLGTCYVGAARNKPRELAAELGCPERVVAVFGLAIGVPLPGQRTAIKPRLPQPVVLHREQWRPEDRTAELAGYDRIMRVFYDAQGMKPDGTWTQQSARRIATVASLRGRHALLEALQSRGLLSAEPRAGTA